VNKCTGVVGVFNCQGAGWCKVEKKTRIHNADPGTLTGTISAHDVDSIAQLASSDWDGQTIVYSYKSGEVIRLPKGVTLPVTLKVLEYELFHISPLKEIAPDMSFAPIGLLNMFNSGGAVEEFNINMNNNANALSDAPNSLGENRAGTATVALRVRGCGCFGAYSSQKPIRCTLDTSEVDFSHDSATGLLTLNIPVPEMDMYKWNLEILV